MEVIHERINELNEICKKYPKSIPLSVAAKFDGIDSETLRTSLKNKSCPFGYTANPGYRTKFIIPTLPFYFFHTVGSFISFPDLPSDQN